MTDLTKIDKPFGELDRDTEIALITAYVDGAQLDVLRKSGLWVDCGDSTFDRYVVYRVHPYLTPDSIDWSHVAPEWRFMARGADGRAVIYQSLPYISGDFWRAPQGVGAYATAFASYRRGAVDWRDSLVVRP